MEYGAGALEILRKQNSSGSCTSHASKVCNNGDVYWKDSCGKLEDVFDSCNSNESCVSGVCKTNQPTCSSHASKVCNNGDVYWRDSCGNKEGIAEQCFLKQCYKEECEYMDNNDGTIYHHFYNQGVKTTLLWQKSAKNEINYINAEKYCASLNLANKTNWKIPSLGELHNLQVMTKTNGCYLISLVTCTGALWSADYYENEKYFALIPSQEPSAYGNDEKTFPTLSLLNVRCVKKIK